MLGAECVATGELAPWFVSVECFERPSQASRTASL